MITWVEAGVAEIREKTKKLAAKGKSWHFHILTPQCQLNKSNRFALVLENATNNEVFVFYSD